MRNGADDAMMAAAGVAVTSASCLNAAADDLGSALLSIKDAPVSGLSKFIAFLSLPVGIATGVYMAYLGFSAVASVGGFFGAFLGMFFLASCDGRTDVNSSAYLEDSDDE